MKLRFVERCAEIRNLDEIRFVPDGIRGICVLLNQQPKSGRIKKGEHDYRVVYVGMARGKGSGVKGRLRDHARNEKKKGLWTHFSVFKVSDEFTDQMIAELEGLLRHIHRRDAQANLLNKQVGFRPLTKIRVNDWSKWN